ncbi:hypothetical protein GQ607_016706 [Colletotrichum asianum]|uniref:Uncharacterized protein n=1 Tax=Colletotrichum asianum TaxID=702518 RepID=A0A8H3VYK0_9PEZI|nr:hypothetical protein GQ607_016706 [Colletotrichum asianum]
MMKLRIYLLSLLSVR